MQSGLDDQGQVDAGVNSTIDPGERASEAWVGRAPHSQTDGHAVRLEAELAAMRRLYELQAKLAFETDLKTALGEIVSAAAWFTSTDRGCVQLVSEDGERLEMFVHHGYEPGSGFIRHFLDQGSKPACDAARQGQQRIIIDDVAVFPALLGTEDRRIALADDVRATQSTPMVSRKGALVGVLSTQFRQPHRSSEHELKLIDMLAWTAADFVDRHLTEAALRRANDARYRGMLEIDTVPVVFFDLVGGISDANDAFLDMIGRTRAELEAGEVRYESLTPPDWVWRDEQTKAELLATGKCKPFEKEYFRGDGSRIWIHCTGKMLDEHTAIEFIIDVTERKRAEQALRASEERQVFLLRLSDRLRPLIDPIEIMVTASAALGQHLGASQVAYAETDLSGEFVTIAREWNDGSIPSNVGEHRLQEFGPAFIADLKRGETIVISDVSLDPRTSSADALATFARVSIGSFVNVPLVKGDRLAAVLAIHASVARAWSGEEVALTEETAERTWAAVERARAEKALRESEARYRTLFEAMDEGYLLADVIFAESGEAVDIAYVAANPAATRMVGTELTGRTLREVNRGYEPYWYEIWGRVARTGQGERLERYAAHEGLWYDFYVFKPQSENSESRRVAVVFQDVTERKRAEEALRESEGRRAFVLSVSDALRPLTDPAAIADVATFHLRERLDVNRVCYGEIEGDTLRILHDHARGVHSIVGTYSLEAFDQAFLDCYRLGNIITVSDVGTDLRLNTAAQSELQGRTIAAFADVVLLENERRVSILAVQHATPRDWSEAEKSLIGEVGERVRVAIERVRAEAALRESEARLRTLMEGVPQLVWRSCDKGQWTWAGPQWLAFTGQSQQESLGCGWLDAVHPDDREHALQAWDEAQPHGHLDIEFRVRRASDGAYLWHQSRSLPERDAEGRIVEWLGTTTDVDDLRRLQEQQGIMVAELQHRTRNLLGVVRSIAQQTMAQTGPTEAFRGQFNDRLSALSRVQGLLSRADQEPITIGALIQIELDALGAAAMQDRIVLAGPSVALRKATVQTFALALHELATNARKYGALSTEQGQLRVTWRTYAADAEGQRLALEWVEDGISRQPEEQSPTRRGYGRELIERALPYALDAKTRYELDETQVRCSIDLPLTERARQKGSR